MKVLFPFLLAMNAVIVLSSNIEVVKKDKFWPEKKSPVTIGKMIIDDFFTRSDVWIATTEQYTSVHYAEACTAFGAARLAGLLKDSAIIQKLSERYTKILTDGPINTGSHVDANVYGILPLELYLQTGDEKFLKQGLELADKQWENPLSDGLTYQTRYWIDDVWMIGSLQVQAYRATGKEIYLERAALEIDTYIQKLQQSNGLFFHGENIPFFWGRGNGWVAAGLAELLTVLPESNLHYKSIVNGYKKMMDALAKYQSEDGMWRQLIDIKEAWEETSSTAMFGYAMTIGVKKGILSKEKFIPVYQKAWLSLTDYIDEEGKVTDVCIGTGQSNDINYYLNRPKVTGDLHGQAPILWFAYSLMIKY